MKRFFSLLLVGLVILMVGCTKSDEPTVKPQLSLTKGSATESSVTFTVETTAVDKVAYLYTDNIAEAPSAETVLAEGYKVEGNKSTEVEISGLEANVTYTIVVAASGGGEIISRSIDMTTKAKEPAPAPEPEYVVDMEMVAGMRTTEIPEYEMVFADNQFMLTFADETSTHIFTLLIFGDEGDKTLQAGTYTEEDMEMAYSTYVYGEEAVQFEKANVDVAVDADVYDIEAIFTDAEGGKYRFTYEGEIINMDANDEPEPQPEEVVFATATSTWMGQYHNVVFATEDESIKLVVDIYTYNYKFGYLYEGIYNVKNSGYSFVAGEIDYYYSSYTVNGQKASLDSGTIEVAINDDLSYIITIDIVDAEGRELKTIYEGVIEGMSFESGFQWVAASRNALANNADGQFNITFKTAGTDSADSITLDFYADASAERLPSGTYPIVSGTEAGVANLDSIVFTTFSQGSPEIDGGEVVVEHLGDNRYNVVFCMTEKDSRRMWICQYEGEIYNMVIERADEELNFVSAHGYYSDDSAESYVYLVADNGKQLKLDLVDLAWQSAYITPGTYTVEAGWSAGGICSGWYGTSYSDGVGFKSGSAIFADNGDQTYTITVNITLENNDVCSGVYVGAVEGYTLPSTDDGGDDASTIALTIERIEAKHYSNINYGVQLLTPGSTLASAGENQTVAYVNLDFYDLAGSTTSITPGTYTVGGSTSGHLDSAYTKIMMSGSKAESGEATFTLNADGSYTITFAITFKDGFTYTGTYTGDITFN